MRRVIPSRASVASRFRDYGEPMGEQFPNYGGMTVNERLSTAGFLREFDAAVNAGDREGAIQVLLKVSMSEESAAATMDTILADPSKYGYCRPS